MKHICSHRLTVIANRDYEKVTKQLSRKFHKKPGSSYHTVIDAIYGALPKLYISLFNRSNVFDKFSRVIHDYELIEHHLYFETNVSFSAEDQHSVIKFVWSDEKRVSEIHRRLVGRLDEEPFGEVYRCNYLKDNN